MKIRNILSTIILVLVLTLTVGFSAFVSEMSISNLVADVRVEKDVRITDVKLLGEQCSGTSVSLLDYDEDSILMNALFSNEGSYAVFEVTITNVGNVDVALADIVSSEEYYKYEIISGELGRKISSLGGTSKYVIKVSIGLPPMNIDMNVKLDFDLRQIYTVTYENIMNNGYPTEIMAGNNLDVTFTGDVPSYITVYSDGIEVNSNLYSYVNGRFIYNDVRSNIVIDGATTFIGVMKNGAISDSDIDFGSSTELSTENNIAYIRSGTENDTNPVYYYRGNVTANNVKFANFCWKIVRTTDTGGTKLIYNGVPASDGSCNNTGTASQLTYKRMFNATYNRLEASGYMIGSSYISSSKSLTSQSEPYLYGNDITWDGTNYTLIDTFQSSSWTTDYTNIAKKYHYTCFNSTGICNDVYYIHYFSYSSPNYLTLKNGENIDTVKDNAFKNVGFSTVGSAINSWYAENMTSYTDMLEDTVWCNDRSFYSGSLKSKDTDAGTAYSYYGAYGRNVIENPPNPSFECLNTNDRFTVSNEIGNGELTYPVGLLTADEVTLAGSGNSGYSSSSFLYTGQYQWTMSPAAFIPSVGRVFTIYTTGSLGDVSAGGTNGVRPSISLKKGTSIASGDGSVSTPYIVE